MFIELTKHEDDEKDFEEYPVLVNVERIMWVSPLINGWTRLYMNVADDDGKPAEIDVTEEYNEVTKLLKKDGGYDAKHRETNDRTDEESTDLSKT